MKDMRVLGGLLVLFFSFFTFGCRNHISNDMSLSTSISQSITNEQTSVESKKSFKEFYKPVFDNYQKILSTPKDVNAIADLYKSLQGTERPINSWSVENAIYQADKIRYAYADLNQDGVEELLVGIEQSSGEYFISGLYYLVNEKPILLAEGFVAGHGGARNSMNIYKDGDILELSWSSGSGEGRGVLYHMNPNQQAANKIQEQNIRVPGNKSLHSDFGKSESELMNFNQLDWQKFEGSSGSTTITGETIVFHSPTTNGGIMYLKPTENTEIQAEFKRLVEEE